MQSFKHVLKMFLCGLLSKKFIIACSVTFTWVVLIIVGKSHVAQMFNEVVLGVDVAFMGTETAQTIFPRRGSSGVQHAGPSNVGSKGSGSSEEATPKQDGQVQ